MRYLFFIIILATYLPLSAQNQINAEGRKEGRWIVTAGDAGKSDYPSSAIYEEGNYSNGRKVGVWKTFHPNGKIKSDITFEAGRPKGPYTTYYDNGQIEEKGNWSLTKNYGKFVRYYENGNVHQEFDFNESGKRTGAQKYYHPNGKLAIEGNWNGGKESGEVKEYYESGELRVVRVFNEGTMDDAQTKHFESKKLTNIPAIKEPEPVMDESNKVKTTATVNKAELQANIGVFDGNGQHTLYNRNRQISQKGEFKNGRLYDGKLYRYNTDGILQKIEIYQNGKYVGEGVIEDSMK